MTNPNEKVVGEEKVNEIPVDPRETVAAQMSATTIEQVVEDPFAKGRERMAAVTGFFSKAKENFIATKNKVGASISRFWSRTKTAASTTTAAVLSSDVLASRADNWVSEKTEQVGAYIGEKGAAAANWVDDNLEAGYDWSQKKREDLQNFIESKADQMTNYVDGKVELAKDVAFYVKEKTTEGLDRAKNGIKNQWDNVKTFGENAIASAKMEAAKVKEVYRNKMNEIHANRLRAEYEKATAQEMKASTNLTEASEKATIAKKKMEEHGQKTGLLRGLSLEVAAA